MRCQHRRVEAARQERFLPFSCFKVMKDHENDDNAGSQHNEIFDDRFFGWDRSVDDDSLPADPFLGY